MPKSTEPSLLDAAWHGRCPNCAAPTLFDGIALFADACPSCGLDYDSFNVGDGPAAFLTLIIGAIVVGLAMWLELGLAPPFWVHAILWVPLVVGAVFAGLRFVKTLLLYAEFARDAGEASIHAARDRTTDT